MENKKALLTFFLISLARKKNIHLISLLPSQIIAEFLQRTPQQLGLLPQIGGQEGVGVTDRRKGSLKSILEGLGRAGRSGVDVLDTSKLEEALDRGRSDQTGTTGSGDQLWDVLASLSITRGDMRGCLP